MPGTFKPSCSCSIAVRRVDARAPQLEHQNAGGFSADTHDDSPGLTALHIAASTGDSEIAKELLDQGADIDLIADKNSYTRSAVEMANSAGHSGTVRLLLDRGAKVDISGTSGYLFIDTTDDELLTQLLDSSDVDLMGKDGARLLSGALANKNNAAIDLLIARGAQVDIFSACRFGRIDDVRRLLQETPAPRAAETDYPRATPITLAVENGHVAVVQFLVDNGVPLSTSDRQSESLAHLAAKHGHLDVLKLLSRNELLIDAKDEAGASLLHAAAYASRPEIARYLISKGADVNATDFSRETPLHDLGGWSARWINDDANLDEEAQRAVATARILLHAGAEVNVKDEYDNTPLHQAASRGLEGVASLLLSEGAEVNARNFRNSTPLGNAGGSTWGSLFGRQKKPVDELLRAHGGIE